MPINNPWEFDVTSNSSNSNVAGADIAENCRPSGLNDAVRFLAGMLAQATSYQSAAISSSVSMNVAASGSGLVQAVLGANAVNSLGTLAGSRSAAAVLRILEFSSSASLSHGPTLNLIGAASRRTQPGDIGLYYHVGSNDAWREIFFSRADASGLASSISATTITAGSISTSAISTVTLNAVSVSITAQSFNALTANSISASVMNAATLQIGGIPINGTVIQTVTTSTATYSNSANTIPDDNSIPQQGGSEGVEILSVSITPKSGSSTLYIRSSGMYGVGTQTAVIAAVFVDATANALFATEHVPIGGAAPGTIAFEFTQSAGSTSARTYRLRVGCRTGGGTVYINGDNSSRLYGGVSRCTLTVEERF